MEREKRLVEYVAQALVDEPEMVEVRDAGSSQLELKVAVDDRGKVIGKKGRTAHAIRTLLAAVSEDEQPVGLEIVDS